MESSLFFLDSIIPEVWFFILGAVLGSFANVCIRRIPDGISVVSPRSRCASCKTPIRAYHNIPLLSWILLGGRCVSCGERISIEYPLVELLCGALALFLYREFGISVELLFYLGLCLALVVITLIDIRHLIIPDMITLPGIAAGVALNAIRTDWQAAVETVLSSGLGDFLPAMANIAIFNSIGGTLLGGGVFLLIASVYKTVRKKEGMGMGDVKLVAMLGAFFGMWGVLIVIFLSSILGTLIGLSVIILRRKDPGYAIAYGPFLSFSAVLYLLGDGLFLLAGIDIRPLG